MKYLYLLGILFCMTNSISQNVQTALHLNKSEKIKAAFPVSEITTTMIFYNKSGVEKKKEVAVLNAQHNVISEFRYDEDGTLTARLTRHFDSTGSKSLGRKFERWHKLMGYSCEVSEHKYDENGFLIKTIERNQNQQVIMVTTIKNDERGNAIEVITSNGSGALYGIEKAEYDYNTNKLTTRVYNNIGELLSETVGKIDYEDVDDITLVKNDQGAIIKHGLSEYEYSYDKKGNWIKQLGYKIENNKRIKKSEFTRKIKYKKL